MELKFTGLDEADLTNPAFNRTIVELKFVQFCLHFLSYLTFNRTIVELKCW